MNLLLLAQTRATLAGLDYLVLGLYFAINLGIGWWCSRRKQAGDAYFTGGGRVGWWAAGISFFATGASSISFMALPAKTFAEDWLSYGAGPAQTFATVVLALGFVRLLKRLQITTVFDYLERRFNRHVRLLGAGLALLLKVGGRMSIVMLLPALALSTVTGLNVYVSIMLMGLVSTAYSMVGGFEAVVWTDVLQVAVTFGGVALAIALVVAGVPGGFSGVWEIGREFGKWDAFSAEWSVTKPTVWVFLGMAWASLFTQLSDQTLMQRVIAGKDGKAGRNTVLLGACLGLPSTILFFFVGTALFAFYQTHPERLDPALSNDAIFPFFIVNELPVGVVGLIIAALFASAMGALSSVINASAGIVVSDFLDLLRPGTSEKGRLRTAWLTSVFAGVIGTGIAAYIAGLGVTSLWDQFLKLIALIGGGFPGVFALGLLTRRANAPGVLVGAVASIPITWWVQTYTTVSVFAHGFVAVGSCMLIGYAVSLVWPSRLGDLRGLTIWEAGNDK